MCDLIRDYIETGFEDMYNNILKNLDDIEFKEDYFGIDYSNCTTMDGHLPCIFPFEFEALEHYSCTWMQSGKHEF